MGDAFLEAVWQIGTVVSILFLASGCVLSIWNWNTGRKPNPRSRVKELSGQIGTAEATSDPALLKGAAK